MRCAAGMLVVSCVKGVQLEHLTLTGRREICSDSRLKHMDTSHLWSHESLREGLFGLDVIDTIMNAATRGTL